VRPLETTNYLEEEVSGKRRPLQFLRLRRKLPGGSILKRQRRARRLGVQKPERIVNWRGHGSTNDDLRGPARKEGRREKKADEGGADKEWRKKLKLSAVRVASKGPKKSC